MSEVPSRTFNPHWSPEGGELTATTKLNSWDAPAQDTPLSTSTLSSTASPPLSYTKPKTELGCQNAADGGSDQSLEALVRGPASSEVPTGETSPYVAPTASFSYNRDLPANDRRLLKGWQGQQLSGGHSRSGVKPDSRSIGSGSNRLGPRDVSQGRENSAGSGMTREWVFANCSAVLTASQMRRAMKNLDPETVGSQQQGPAGANVFVFHLPNGWRDLDLAIQFAQFGRIVSARIATDNATGRQLGFGFVSFQKLDDAVEAVKQLNGFALNGKRLKVTIKRGEQHIASEYWHSVEAREAEGPCKGSSNSKKSTTKQKSYNRRARSASNHMGELGEAIAVLQQALQQEEGVDQFVDRHNLSTASTVQASQEAYSLQLVSALSAAASGYGNRKLHPMNVFQPLPAQGNINLSLRGSFQEGKPPQQSSPLHLAHEGGSIHESPPSSFRVQRSTTASLQQEASSPYLRPAKPCLSTPDSSHGRCEPAAVSPPPSAHAPSYLEQPQILVPRGAGEGTSYFFKPEGAVPRPENGHGQGGGLPPTGLASEIGGATPFPPVDGARGLFTNSGDCHLVVSRDSCYSSMTNNNVQETRQAMVAQQEIDQPRSEPANRFDDDDDDSWIEHLVHVLRSPKGFKFISMIVSSSSSSAGPPQVSKVQAPTLVKGHHRDSGSGTENVGGPTGVNQLSRLLNSSSGTEARALPSAKQLYSMIAGGEADVLLRPGGTTNSTTSSLSTSLGSSSGNKQAPTSSQAPSARVS